MLLLLAPVEVTVGLAADASISAAWGLLRVRVSARISSLHELRLTLRLVLEKPPERLEAARGGRSLLLHEAIGRRSNRGSWRYPTRIVIAVLLQRRGLVIYDSLSNSTNAQMENVLSVVYCLCTRTRGQREADGFLLWSVQYMIQVSPYTSVKVFICLTVQ